MFTTWMHGGADRSQKLKTEQFFKFSIKTKRNLKLTNRSEPHDSYTPIFRRWGHFESEYLLWQGIKKAGRREEWSTGC